MSNFNKGELVLLYVPCSDTRQDIMVPSGSIGEVVATFDGFVSVDFPCYPAGSRHPDGWAIPEAWLKPLGGKWLLDDDDREDNPYNKFSNKPLPSSDAAVIPIQASQIF